MLKLGDIVTDLNDPQSYGYEYFIDNFNTIAAHNRQLDILDKTRLSMITDIFREPRSL